MKNKTITVQNVLKVIDIDKGDISKATLKWLSVKSHTIYKDMSLNEDMYNVPDPLDHLSKNKVVKSEINILCRLAAKNDAGYIRLID